MDFKAAAIQPEEFESHQNMRERTAHTMKTRVRETTRLFSDAFRAWVRKDPFRQSAVIAYYAIFSLPGLVLLVGTLAGKVVGQDSDGKQLYEPMGGALGRDTVVQIRTLADVIRGGRGSTGLGIAIVLLGATGVFVQLQKSLNAIWEVTARPTHSCIRNFLKARFLSFGLILAIAFLLLFSLLVSAAFAVMGRWFEPYWPDYTLAALQTLNCLLSISIISSLFAIMFKLLPDVKTAWRTVWVGALLTALMFEFGKIGLGHYFGRALAGSGYGAAGSVIVMLSWLSYSAMIVFYGAEFTKAYADHFDGVVVVDTHAVRTPGPTT